MWRTWNSSSYSSSPFSSSSSVGLRPLFDLWPPRSRSSNRLSFVLPHSSQVPGANLRHSSKQHPPHLFLGFPRSIFPPKYPPITFFNELQDHQFLRHVQSTVLSEDHHYSIKIFIFSNITRLGFHRCPMSQAVSGCHLTTETRV